MILNIVEFTEDIGRSPLPSTILFGPGTPPFGKEDFEPFLVERALEKILAAYVDPSLRDFAFSIFYAEETPPGIVAEEALTTPFLAERRVILVRNANVYMAIAAGKRSPLQPLVQFIENPPDTATLLLVAPAINKARQLYKACSQHGLVVESPQLTDSAYGAWIRKQVEEKGNKIGTGAITLLMDRVGARMDEMHNAINLVCNYAGVGTAITDEHVRAASGDVAEATVWALTDAIAASNPTAALEALHDLLGMNKSPDEIIGTINWLLENAYRAHPQTPMKVGKPFVERKVTPLARKFTEKRLIDALALCTKTHFALRTTGSDARLQLELLIIKLAAAKK
ncbi:MAG TPA: DNA polymerase III subunit delta [Candidatus Hydrogenedentes bacterium]|jgi:DNA polymerase-3 subunit delta|nr:MAG: DNA polymerase III subunit delta [Candidatus Hydrogenedentes bacterium ADurb.Bin101]HOC69218.1 DNA polymerase III subunit delta [Candidatus Hydrogenedentota bacterium]HQN00883.1 DNA polymerase III subunit delta [Candidatus Hydrogenedentota bacterium]